MTEMPKAPVGMGATGRKLWRDLHAAAMFREDEAVVVEKACRTADDLRRLEAALKSGPVMVTGSMGQSKPNPLFAECRASRAALAALLKQLAIPDPQEKQTGKYVSETSTKAVVAARARWSGRPA